MALFDKLKKTLEDATGEAVKTAQNIGNSVKDIKVDDISKNIAKMGEGVLKKGEDAVNSIASGGSDFIDGAKKSLAKKPKPNNLITDIDALKIIYYMMCADGIIDGSEQRKFKEIGLEVDRNFPEYEDELISECNKKIQEAEDAEDRYDLIHDGVNDCLSHSWKTHEGSIQPKLLLWNLTAIAFSEGEYAEEEKRLMRYIARQMNVDKSAVAEMEHTIQTLIALEKEEQWLKSSNRQYKEIEAQLNELSDRKLAIMRGIHALMLD